AGKLASYANIVEDINRQDEDEQQGKVLKATLESLKRITSMGTRAILYGIQKELDDPSYWDIRSPELRFFNTYSLSRLSDIATDLKTGWLEEVKVTSLESDFAQAILENTDEHVRKRYIAEKEKVKRLRDAVKSLSMQAAFVMLFGQAKLDERTKVWLVA